MNFIKRLAESGLNENDSYQDKRSVILTNYVSIILLCAAFVMIVARATVYKGLYNVEDLYYCAVVFAMPLALNMLSRTRESRLLVCIAPTLTIWYVFVKAMLPMEQVPQSVYDGLMLYLLASSCIPYLVLTRTRPGLFMLGIMPSLVSIVLFSPILTAFGIGYTVPAGSDAELMQFRFVLCSAVISGGCYMLQSVILKSDELNTRLIKSLEEKTAQIECQNGELVRNQDQLAQINQTLERLVEERTKQISVQRDRIMSYAFANAHYVRGPIARLMGLIELYKIDKELDCDWLLKTVDRETRDIDTTIRKISAELQPD